MKMMYRESELQEFHALDPVVSDDCTILILVSMPSVDSIRENSYYADPANRFWPLLSAIYRMPVQTKEERMDLLKKNHIAIWSVIKTCLRYKSREDTMQDIVLNDISAFLKKYPRIRRIVCVSHDTLRLLQEADLQACSMAYYVPSTSSADLWYDAVDKLLPEYARALGVIR